MQAQLADSEFSWILQAVGAQQIVGVDNRALFPTDENNRDALLANGLTKLQEHGWLVDTGEGYDINDRLMRMAAVSAAPETVLQATRFGPDTFGQAVTWYVAQGCIVEQQRIMDGQYCLIELVARDRIVECLQEIFTITPATFPWEATFSIPVSALISARMGKLTFLRESLTEADVPAMIAIELSQIVCRLRPIGRIQGAASHEGTAIWKELALLHDGKDRLWMAQWDRAQQQVIFTPLSQEALAEQAMRLLST